MANTIKLKRSSTASAIPSTANLQLGELAVNTFDGKLFLKKNDGVDSIVELGIPAGSIQMFAGSTAPTGWVLCDGSALNTYTYRVLHKVISNTYGGTAFAAGTTDQSGASTTFNVPDLLRRHPVGKGSSESLGASDGLTYANRSVSHTHGVKAHYHGMGTGATLATTSGGAHKHTINARSSSTGFGTASATGRVAGGTDADFSTGDGGSADEGAHSHSMTGLIGLVTGGVNGNEDQATHSTTTPYMALHFIIKT